MKFKSKFPWVHADLEFSEQDTENIDNFLI